MIVGGIAPFTIASFTRPGRLEPETCRNIRVEILHNVKICCIMKYRTTVYFVFCERDSESLSFHSYLSYSLHKSYKSFLTKLLLNGLVPLSLNAPM